MDKDLTLVSVIPGAGLPLIASKQSGVKTLDDFVAFARKKGQVNFGTYSAGSSPHMTINELNKQYGLKIEPIHYRGEVLEPALGFKETNALYQREMPVWIESAQALGLEPV